jgi:hypothetical protein
MITIFSPHVRSGLGTRLSQHKGQEKTGGGERQFAGGFQFRMSVMGVVMDPRIG